MAKRGSRVGSFSRSGLRVEPWRPPETPPDVSGAASPVPADPEPLAPLLSSLWGREITVTVGNRLITGRLIQLDPILLVNQKGEVTAVAPGRISAVTF